MRPRNIGRISGGAVGEGDQERFVCKHMLEHPYEEVRMACRLADTAGRQTGCREEAGEPVGILGEERKRLNRQ